MLDSTAQRCSPTFRKNLKKNPKSNNSTSSRRPRKVTFYKHVMARSVPCRNNLHQQTIDDIWYCQSEYKAMKKDSIRICRDLAANKIPTKGLESEARGLGCMGGKGRRIMKQNVNDAYKSVLEEQARQIEYYGKIVDPEQIAKVYIQVNKLCQDRALKIAASDAKIVKPYLTSSLTQRKTNTDKDATIVRGDQKASISNSLESKTPETIEEALRLDREAGNTIWTDAIRKEVARMVLSADSTDEKLREQLRQFMTFDVPNPASHMRRSWVSV